MAPEGTGPPGRLATGALTHRRCYEETRNVSFLLQNHTRRFILPVMRHRSLDPLCGRELFVIRALPCRQGGLALERPKARNAESGTTTP
jgi:hypothetical protein